MDDEKGRRTDRRQVVIGALSLIGAGLVVHPAWAALTATPRQTAGPFYPPDWTGDIDWDLVRVNGEAAQAQGIVTYVSGRVTDAMAAPVAGAIVEIWQCDANGRYRHPAEAGRGRVQDNGFQGRGRAMTDAEGNYRFRTIRPVQYPGRTPHIHFRVRTPAGADFITQMYVAGEARNATDFLFNRLDAPQQAALAVRLEPADRIETGALAGTFDIVLG